MGLFSRKATELDKLIEAFRQAEADVDAAQARLDAAVEARNNCRLDLLRAKAGLFDEFPELAPEPPAAPTTTWSPPSQVGLPEPIEIDDPEGPMPIVWRERG